MLFIENRDVGKIIQRGAVFLIELRIDTTGRGVICDTPLIEL